MDEEVIDLISSISSDGDEDDDDTNERDEGIVTEIGKRKLLFDEGDSLIPRSDEVFIDEDKIEDELQRKSSLAESDLEEGIDYDSNIEKEHENQMNITRRRLERNEKEKDKKILKTFTYAVIRNRIKSLLKELPIFSFLQQIDIPPLEFAEFMNIKNSQDGERHHIYLVIARYFYSYDQEKKKSENPRKRSRVDSIDDYSQEPNENYIKDDEINNENEFISNENLPLKESSPSSSLKKSRKTSKHEQFFKDVDTMNVLETRVFDDCDAVRKKIISFLEETNISKSQFADLLGVSWKSFRLFQAGKSWNDGSNGITYPKSYFFFERLRMYRKQFKSERRRRMEIIHPFGFIYRHEF